MSQWIPATFPGVSRKSLSVKSAVEPGASIPLDEELVIGRSTPVCAAISGDLEISRVHARVWHDADGRLMIEDLASRNGTYVNGVRVDIPQLLGGGDEVRMGRTTMEVVERPPGRFSPPTYDALLEEE
jgi:pSer/pThr/pTyr-binding forkhead associated (FHA) protein